MVSIKITTTVKKHIAEIAISKGIKWSVALERGILSLINEVDDVEIPFDPSITIEHESPIAKKQQAMNVMQAHINDLNEEIEELRRKL